MKRTAAVMVAVLFAACQPGDKTTGPTGPVEAVSIDFCGLRPNWFAIQNEGDVWKQVAIPASGPITFDATERVSIAMAITFFGTITVITNVTRDELGSQDFNVLGCDLFADSDREVTGTVFGLGSAEFATVTIHDNVNSVFVNSDSWVISALSNSAVDLVGIRLAPDGTPNRTIVRRNVIPQLAPAAPIPVLNFAATEAVAPEAGSVTVSGIGADLGDLLNTFITANGTSAPITNTSALDAALPFFSVPASQRNATDLHELSVVAYDMNGNSRDAIKWFQTPAATTTLALGPMVNAPTISQAATSPELRMRALLNAQTEYPSGAGVVFSQVNEATFEFKFVLILTSAGFAGSAPTNWDLTTPDLSGAGYQAAWGLAAANPVEWQVTAFNGSGGSLFVETPVFGVTVTSSTRTSPSFSNTARFGKPKRPSLRVLGTPIPRQSK